MTARSTLLAAEVAVTGARGKARSSPGRPHVLLFLPGDSRAEPQASGRTYVPGETAVTQCHPAGERRPACLCERFERAERDVSLVYVFKQKILRYLSVISSAAG